MAIMVTPVYCRELIKILELCTEWRVECTIPKSRACFENGRPRKVDKRSGRRPHGHTFRLPTFKTFFS
jgi:hypothetical protein